MPKSNSREAKALQLFSSKLERLRDGRFARILKTEGFERTVSFQIGGATTVEKRGPDDDSIQAALLTVRFFIQNNEACSLKNIGDLYEKPGVPEVLRNEMRYIRKILNDYLDSDRSRIASLGATKLSPRKILYAILYGDLAHSSKDHRKIYEKLFSTPFSTSLAEVDFMKTMIIIYHAVFTVGELNKKLLAAGYIR
jgi:hypothetical protein